MSDMEMTSFTSSLTSNFTVLLTTTAAVIGLISYFTLQYKKNKPCLSPLHWKKFPLLKKTKISPNTNMYFNLLIPFANNNINIRVLLF
jgi:hypothetical protein